ncbi:MAG: MG2 domain-containing protein [Pyrinomonadaceae bacterium]
MRLKSLFSLALILTILLTLVPPPSRAGVTQDGEQADDTAAKSGLRFRLSEGEEKVERPAPNPVAAAAPLTKAETEKLLARLPPVSREAGDVQDFKLRESSLPPPRAGLTIQAAFAQPEAGGPPPPSKTDAPLEVLRFAPEGEVELAPALSITFSQPMVAVSSQDEAAASVPVELTPRPAGRWRWLSAQTLVFQPEAEGGRMPMATGYSVIVPAGTKSALGNALKEAKTFDFSTPPPKLINFYPRGESLPRDTLMFLEFDQRVDAAQVLGRLKTQPAEVPRLRLATPEEIAADEELSDLVKHARDGRWFALRAVNPDGTTRDALPPDASVSVVIPPGTPSAEGPRTTASEQSFSFKTYGALRVKETECGAEKRCTPFDEIDLTLSNQLDEHAFKPSRVTISPAIPGAKISLAGASIQVEGDKRSNTTYTVTLDRSLKDTFGQTLTGENRFSFKVTTAEPNLFGEGDGFVVLDPAGRRAFNVYSVNHRRLKVSLYKVAPEDWSHFRAYEALRYDRLVGGKVKENLRPPGKLVFEKAVEVKGAPDEYVETSVDLSPALTNGYGQAFVSVVPLDEGDDPVRVYGYGPSDGGVDSWVQATDIGLDAFADKSALVVWANSLKDGSPLEGVRVSVVPEGLSAATGADGVARIEFRAREKSGEPLLIARRGEEVAILPQSYPQGSAATWRRAEDEESLTWYVFDDRKLYRPGEEVSVKGWIRNVDLRPSGDTGMIPRAGDEAVDYVLKDSQDNEVSKGSARLSALAGFDFKLRLPATMNLGDASLELKLHSTGQTFTHNFQVQEFRRPEFEIEARVSEAPHFVGSAATVTATAKYYAGGGLPDTEVEWTVLATPTNYTPPNRDDYVFGEFVPWWGDAESSGESQEQTFKGRTDAQGQHTLRMDFDSVSPARPSSVVAEARVQDVNRQTLAARATLLVHPSDVYVGLKPVRTFVQKGEAFDVAVITTDIDGKALAGRDVALRLVRLDYVYEEGEWRQKEADAQEQTVKSGADAVSVRLPVKEGGEYRLTARVRDERERPNETRLSLWVAGGKLPPKRAVEQETVELIPDRRNYKGGDVAEILVQSPFAPAEGVLTLRRSGLLRTERFQMRENSYTLRVPIDEAMTPNVHVQVDLVGAAARVDDEGKEHAKLPQRPAYASGELNLEVPPDARRLNVKATPRATVLEPGQETFVDVEVKDAQGRAVQGTDTAVVVVDESILALTDYKLEDPLGIFYPARDADTSDYHLRANVSLADLEELERYGRGANMGGGGPGGGGGGGVDYARTLKSVAVAREMAVASPYETVNVSSSNVGEIIEPPINVRRNFDALAVFAASLPTDAAGRAQVRVKLPDNLTRYRVTAVSVAGGKLAGKGESAITARLPLMARPSAPRFLNFGDRAELPVVLQNQTDRALSVGVAVRATNAELTEGAGRRVSVPANDRVEVRFPVAAVKPGTARFQVVAAAGAGSDAAEISLPVYTPATTEAFATYGVIDEGAIAQPVKAPADAVKDFGGLEVTTASTQLQELTDAFIYLYNYPFDCSEQLASRVISVAALKDVLAAFKTKDLPSPEAMRAAVGADIKRLGSLQNDDGGFDFWQRGRPSAPFVSVHVAHALVRAKAKGFDVPAEMLEKAHDFLRGIGSKIPNDYSPDAKRAIKAYALYVRALTNDRDAAEARALIANAGGVEQLSLESLGWLLPVLSGDAASGKESDAIRRHLNNRVTETAGAAHFADRYSDGAYTTLQSDRRADGVLLDALIGDRPASDLIPKLVRGLLGGRRRGRWSNTQENVFVLLALDRYFQTYEKATPDFVARVWLGGAFAGERAFRGRSIDRQQLNLSMSALAERTSNAPADLTIGKEGVGRLYFRIGTRYAPSNLKLEAADYGFRVERVYEAVDDPRDVKRDAEGVWHVRAGARVRVRVRMLNPARRYHVALVDPLPAGLEALNPELATTERLPDASSEAGVYRGGRGVIDYYWLWRGPWYEHQNLRDERAEAFTSLLWEGEHEYSYFARATTPGLYVVPPAKAEEMYAPETFGRGQTDRVRVE